MGDGGDNGVSSARRPLSVTFIFFGGKLKNSFNSFFSQTVLLTMAVTKARLADASVRLHWTNETAGEGRHSSVGTLNSKQAVSRGVTPWSEFCDDQRFAISGVLRQEMIIYLPCYLPAELVLCPKGDGLLDFSLTPQF